MAMRPTSQFAALLVANHDYANWQSLKGCQNDVNTLEDAIRRACPHDLQLDVQSNLDHESMTSAIEHSLQARMNLFMFAGHGVETGQGTFILPTDAPPHGCGPMELNGKSISVKRIVRKFRCTRPGSVLVIVLACCRDPVQSAPVPLRIPLGEKKSSGDIVLYACEPGERIWDTPATTLSLEGEVRQVSTLALACANAFVLAAYAGWDLPGRMFNVVSLARELAHLPNCKGVKKFYPELSVSAGFPNVKKNCGLDVVPAASLGRTIKDILDVLRSPGPERSKMNPAFCKLMSFYMDNYANDRKVVGHMRAVLGDHPVMACCRRRAALVSPAIEVYACGQAMYRLQRFAKEKRDSYRDNNTYSRMAENYMQRGLRLVLSTDLDHFVLASFMICFSYYLKAKHGSDKEEMTWKRDSWQYGLLASELHQSCGVTELSHVNFLSAMDLRLRLSCKSPENLNDIERALRGMPALDQLTDRRLLHRMSLILRTRRALGQDMSSEESAIFEAAHLCPERLHQEMRGLLNGSETPRPLLIPWPRAHDTAKLYMHDVVLRSALDGVEKRLD